MAILGVIAAFTIPKILMAQQGQQELAKAKEVASVIGEAYTLVKANSGISTSTVGDDFAQYINYVALDTTSSVDDFPNGNGNYVCGSNVTCYRLHNGGIFFYRSTDHYYGTAPNYAFTFFFDPDGVREGVVDNVPGKSIAFFLYANGRLVSRGTCEGGYTTASNSTTINICDTSYDPYWFQW